MMAKIFIKENNTASAIETLSKAAEYLYILLIYKNSPKSD
jgi:hypothetical protein